MALYIESMDSKGDESDRLFNLAMRRFEAASSSTLDNKFTVKSWADALCEQAKRKTGDDRDKLISQATEKYISIESVASLANLAISLAKQASVAQGVNKTQCYRLAYSNFKAALHTMRNFGEIALKVGNFGEISLKIKEEEEYSLFYHWGEALATQALSNASENSREQLLDEAGEKFITAINSSKDKELAVIHKRLGKNIDNKEMAAIVLLYLSSNFQSIDSTTCPYITDKLVLRILAEYPHLQTLRVDNTVTNFTGTCLSHQFTSLTTLEIRDSTKITDDTIDHISKNCKSLTSLSLGGCSSIVNFKVTSSLVHLQTLDIHDCRQLSDVALVNIGMSCCNIIDLNVAGCVLLTNNGFIGGISMQCAKIKNLNINNCKKMDSEVVVAMATRMKGLVNVKLAGLVTVTASAISTLAKQCKEITGIRLTGLVEITDACIIDLAEHGNLEHLDINRCKNVGNQAIRELADKCPKLKSLSVSECLKLTDNALTYLAARCTQLSTLELGGLYKISDETIYSLAEHCTSLTTLNISYCDKISSKSILALTQVCKQLSTVNFHECKSMDDETITSLAGSQLKKLNVSNCKNLSNEALMTVANKSNSLQVIALGWLTKFTSAPILAMARNCSASLRKVDFRECKHVTDEYLAGLVNCPNLEELWLDSCAKVTDLSIMKISQYCSLKSLRLSGCHKISDAGIMHMAQNSPRLQVLTIGRCYKVTDASIAKIAKHCLAIQVLNLNGCKQITDASLILLGSKCHSLIKLQLDAVQQISKNVLLDLMKVCPLVEVSNKF